MQLDTIKIAAIAVVLGINCSFANAATVNAFAQTSVSGVETTDDNSSPASASALAQDPGGEAQAQSAADVGGQLGASASFFGAGGDQAEVSASASWSESFISTAGSSAQFDFFIPGAAIGIQANNVCCLQGGYDIKIQFNGDDIFSATGVLTQVPEPSGFNNFPSDPDDVNLVQTGTILAPTFTNGIAEWFGGPGNGAGYLFGSFGDSLTLNPQDGDNFLIYTMDVFVLGLIGETSAIASIGDPFALTQNGPDPSIMGATLSFGGGPSPVPLPAGVWLFATALLGLVGFTRPRLLYRA